MRVHDVFHVSLLTAWKDGGKQPPPPPAFRLNGQTVYELNKILNHRPGKPKTLRQFLVRWEGYSHEDGSWELEASIMGPKLVQDYWDSVASSEQHTMQQAKQKP